MKIMYVDYSIEGHHLEYLRQLTQNCEYESIVVLPQYVGDLPIRQVCYPNLNLKEKKLIPYLKYMWNLKKIAEKEQPDIIHFLDGDSAMRYFDIGYRCLKKFRVAVTFHHLFPGKMREISIKSILHTVSVGIVHTDEIADRIENYGVSNVQCIHYPCFLPLKRIESSDNQPKTLLALGGTRYDKGLDLLLEALRLVKEEFRLVIAGKEEFFTREYIEKAVWEYREKVDLRLKFLSKEEMMECLQSADMIVLPYRKEFDGASGPMCEGAYLGKMILGPDHGSLGAMIKNNHLGDTFASENVLELAQCIERAVKAGFSYDETAKRYQKSLEPERFLESHKMLYDSLIR